MTNQIQRLERRYEREKKARLEAENLLEQKSRELYESAQKLQVLSSGLEKLVAERTAELETARDAALASARSKSDFLANMSHEIRTPMNGVLGMLQALRQIDDPIRQEKLLRTAEDSGKLLVSIINDVLEFSKLESEGVSLQTEDFSLINCVESVVQNFAATAHEKDLDIVLDVSVTLPRLVKGDEIRLKQVLGNLISNAIKFTECGSIIVSVKPLSNGEFCFAVQDTGIGLSQEHIGHIFHAFDQADGSVTRKFGGSGLGLSICSKVIKAHGSHIEVKSEEGKGACFHFTLKLEISDKATVASTVTKQYDDIAAYIVSENQSRRQAFLGVFEAMELDVAREYSSLSEVSVSDLDPNSHQIIFLDGLAHGENEKKPLMKLRSHFPHLKSVELITYSHQDQFSELIDYQIIKPISIQDILNFCAGNFRDATQSQEDEFEESFDFSGKKLLVVDDNDVNLQVASAVFETSGFEVDLAESGEVAIKLCQEKAFDMILMDIQMPGMDGFETSKHIRELSQYYLDLPILAMTAHAMKEDREKSLKAGMNEHIPKPIETSIVLPKLAEFLGVSPIVIRKAKLNIAKKSSEKNSSNPYQDLSELDIPDLEGFDLPDALKRLRGRWYKLRSLIIDFIQKYESADIELKQHIVSVDVKAAEHFLHTIKGSAGNIGAKSLSKISGELEAHVKREENLEFPEHLCEEFSYQVANLREVMPLLKAPDSGVADDTPSKIDKTVKSDINKEKLFEILQSIVENAKSDLGRVMNDVDAVLALCKNTEYEDLADDISQAFNKFKLDAMVDIAKRFINLNSN